MTLTALSHADIKARCAAATEGPWVRDMHSPDMSGRSGWYIRGPRKLGLRSMVLNSRMLPGDAEFIEHAREDVPWLGEWHIAPRRQRALPVGDPPPSDTVA